MPFSKIVKDHEGAIAEVISTDLSFAFGINHPALDKPNICIKDEVTVILPQFIMEQSLADMVIEGDVIPQNDNFLKTLGETIAFNWYIGQGDLNATNISIYPFNLKVLVLSSENYH